MTSTHLVRPATPTPIKTVRALVVVQTVIGIGTTLMLGFLALLGLAWTADDDGGLFDGLVIVVVAMFALSLAATIAIPVLAGALRPGANGVRTALVVIEAVVATGTLLLLSAGTAGWDLGSVLLAPMLSFGCAVATVVALLMPPARIWSTGPAWYQS